MLVCACTRGNDQFLPASDPATNTIYVVSQTALYTADRGDGHVDAVGTVAPCGTGNAALTATSDGKLYAADNEGALCEIDPGFTPPKVTQIGTLGSNLSIAGDLVGLGNGSLYGTAVKPASSSDLLIQIDPSSGNVTNVIGSMGFSQVLGLAYASGLLYGFTRDGSVLLINRQTGMGAVVGTFTDPTTGHGVAFSGAGMNALAR
jgi:hypothetical protein